MDRELRRRAPGVFREKMTRAEVIQQNVQLGKQLQTALEQCNILKARMVGYTKVFVHMLGGTKGEVVRVPKHAFAEILRGYDLEIKEPDDALGEPASDFVFILTKKAPKQEEKADDVDAPEAPAQG